MAILSKKSEVLGAALHFEYLIRFGIYTLTYIMGRKLPPAEFNCIDRSINCIHHSMNFLKISPKIEKPGTRGPQNASSNSDRVIWSRPNFRHVFLSRPGGGFFLKSCRFFSIQNVTPTDCPSRRFPGSSRGSGRLVFAGHRRSSRQPLQTI
jgi:hypothetical protein